ncbi:hypothetical protein ACTFIW_012453 [Dictyostelium discoideum]
MEINNEYNKNNEILFWKVYRNVYLNNQIFENLSSMNIECSSIIYLNLESRMKFKFIISLEWMVQKNLFELIRYKINKNEFIQITPEGVRELIKASSFTRITITPEGKKMQTKVDNEVAVELFKLLLEKRSEHVLSTNPINNALLYKRYKIIEILVNEPYCASVDGENFLQFIRRSIPIPILMKLHENYLKLGNKMNFSKMDIFYLYGNSSCEVLYYLLDTLKIDANKIEIFQASSPKFFFSSCYPIKVLTKMIDIGYFNNSISKENENENSIQYFSMVMDSFIKSKHSKNITTDIIELLFKLFLKINLIKNTKTQNDIDLITNEILLIKSQNNNNNNNQQLFKFLVKTTNSRKLYKLYYYNYFELVEENEILKLNNFNKLKTNNILNIIKGFIIKGCKDSGDDEQLDIDNFIKFLESFSNEYKRKKWQLDKVALKFIRNTIFKYVNNNEQYEKIKKSINIKMLDIIRLPLEWNPKLKQFINENEILIIDSKETVDWLLKSTRSVVGLKSIYNQKRRLEMVTFESYQLFQYTINKMESTLSKKHIGIYKTPINLKPIIWSQILNNPLSDALTQCNLINDIIDPQFQNKTINIIHLIKSLPLDFKPQELNSNLQVYFNFNFKLIKNFINQINNNNNNNSFEILSKIKIDFSKQKKYKIIEELYESIIGLDLNYCLVLLNSIDLFDDINGKRGYINSFLEYWDSIPKYQIKSPISNFIYLDYNTVPYIDTNIDNFIQFFKFWINNTISTLQAINNSNNLTSNIAKIKVTVFFQTIITHLYNRLIQIRGIKFLHLFEIRKLINDINKHINSNHNNNDNNNCCISNFIVINHNSYHVFYYILLKYPSIIKYFFLIYDILKPLGDNNYVHNYDYDKFVLKEPDNSKDRVRRLLDENIFTYDYIFGTTKCKFDQKCFYPTNGAPFETILQHFLQFNHNTILGKVNSYSKSIFHSTQLIYFLNIRRFDLFLKEVKYIQSLNKTIEINDLIIGKIIKYISNVSQKIDFQLLQKSIDQLSPLIIGGVKKCYEIFLRSAISYQSTEIISYIINQYKIDSLESIYSINRSNYNLYEYFCKNHPNCKISFIGHFNVSLIPFLKLWIQYLPLNLDLLEISQDSVNKFKTTKRFEILEILNETGFIKKDDNCDYILTTKIQDYQKNVN